MGKVQFGLIIPDTMLDLRSRHLYMENVHRLLNAVKGHFASAWCIDHLKGTALEGWTALVWLAALHAELVWGHTVLCQSFRNPALLSRMGATLQFMSGGRFVLGIGAGGHAAEYLAYGYQFPSAGVRVEQLDEALQIIRAMWTQKRATVKGTHHCVREASCEPKPDPVLPIMVGAFRPKMLRLTARHADWWNVSSTGIAAYRAYHREFERACDELGRDPATVRRVWSGGCVCAPTEPEVASLAAARLALGDDAAYEVGVDFVGTPSQLIDQMQPFIELGVDYFMLDCGGFPRLTTVETLIQEVLPALDQ